MHIDDDQPTLDDDLQDHLYVLDKEASKHRPPESEVCPQCGHILKDQNDLARHLTEEH